MAAGNESLDVIVRTHFYAGMFINMAGIEGETCTYSTPSSDMIKVHIIVWLLLVHVVLGC